MTQYNVREFKLIKNQEEEITKAYAVDSTFKTVDQIVIEELTNIDSDSFNTSKLVEIYNGL